MKTQKLPVLMICLIISACTSSNIYSDRDNTVDLSSYRTFAWYPTPNDELENNAFNNQIIENNIKDEATGILEAKGYKADVEQPDLLLEYDIMVKKKTRTEQQPIYAHRYNYRYYGPYNPYWRSSYMDAPYVVGYKTVKIPYQEGTLTISAIDRKTNRLVWRGWSVGTVNSAAGYGKQLQKDVPAIFKKFPAHASGN